MNPSNPKSVAIYGRVSTPDQNVEAQLLDLHTYSESRGWVVFKEYIDEGISGTKDRRPALDRLMADARKRKFDLVLVWRFDRFARSTRHLILALEEFRHLGIGFVSYQENIDTGSALGQAIFVIISAISQLEKDVIRERVLMGLRRARSKGKRLGRPPVKVPAKAALELAQEGYSQRQIATRLGVSRPTVARLLRAAEKPSEILYFKLPTRLVPWWLN